MVGSATTLPGYRWTDWHPRLSVPDDRRFALIGDADCVQRHRRCVVASQYRTNRVELRLPNGIGILFNPAVLRHTTGERSLCTGDGRTGLIKQNAARATGTFVAGKKITTGRQDLYYLRYRGETTVHIDRTTREIGSVLRS